MIKKITAGLLFIWLCLYSGHLQASDDGWQIRRNSDGVKIYTRPVEDSPILEFKGVTYIRAPLYVVIQLFLNQQKFCTWLDRCKNSRILEVRGPEGWIMYLHLGFPWPVADRDIVMLRTREEDPETGTFTFRLSERTGFYPEQPGRVRMPAMRGFWRFTPAEDGLVEVVFQQHVDAGGFIPSWVANSLVVEIPFNSLRNFRKDMATSENIAILSKKS